MAKIILNNKEYQIDDATLVPVTDSLKAHLSTVMNGEGAVIALDGVEYGIDATKLAAAKDDFVAHLGTIAGSGFKVVVNGVEYSVDSAKMAGVIARLEDAFDELENSGEPGLGFPIAWNSMDVQGNPTFILGSQIPYVKVSDFTPTAEELLTTKLSDIEYYLPCQMARDMGGFAAAVYGDNEVSVFSIFTAGEHDFEGEVINIPEAGFYALDFGIMGENYDLVIDLVGSTT
jgi:hypothetical protein